MEVIFELILTFLIEGVETSDGRQLVPKFVRITAISILTLGISALMVLLIITCISEQNEHMIVICIVCGLVILFMLFCLFKFVQRLTQAEKKKKTQIQNQSQPIE